MSLVWRYGVLGPWRAQRLVAWAVERFLRLYEPTQDGGPWLGMQDLIDRLAFRELVQQTAQDWFISRGVGKKFVEEVIGAATRCNYASVHFFLLHLEKI